MSHGRPAGDPKTLADILAAYCHLPCSLPDWLVNSLVFHFQNFQRGACRGALPTKTLRVILIVLALVALARVTGVGIGWLPAGCLGPGDRMPRARVAHEDFIDLHIVPAISRARVDRMAVVDATTDCVTLDDLDTHCDGIVTCLWTRQATLKSASVDRSRSFLGKT